MGRHGGRGEGPSHDREKPEPAQEPDHRDEPIGRRLRPEESAGTHPGWPAGAETVTGFPASGEPGWSHEPPGPHGPGWPHEPPGPREPGWPHEAETVAGWPDEPLTSGGTGFLGSGWSSEPEPRDARSGRAGRSEADELDWPDEGRGVGGRIKMTVLAVTAVAAVIGGTVAGVQAWKSPGAASADCSSENCFAAAPGASPSGPEATGPETDDAPPSEDVPAVGDPAQAGEETTAPPSQTSAPPRGTGRDRRPDPTPTSTRAPREGDVTDDGSSADGPQDDQPSAAEETAEPLGVDRDDRNDAPAPNPSSSQTPTASPSSLSDPPGPADPSDPEGPPSVTGGAAISVGFGVVRQRSRAYTAEVVIAADEKVGPLRLTLPVSGEVSSVSGAEWSQDGDSLLLKSTEGLTEGGELVVTFTATGRARAPRTCESAQGECSVT
ncbi:hypothetical protein [Planobispora takensis]|uniref:CBM2 domain-containing protein n=1 Tax=Planobispora takensis TaxID=1367882 RepID=A0A8J3WTS3_9ACTN|nr:hypothetical protein [Planobispora takensis]GII00683.1 hypothetical protein Pta02_26910 [Planobispora takensis]